jgi:hypothetical protein
MFNPLVNQFKPDFQQSLQFSHETLDGKAGFCCRRFCYGQLMNPNGMIFYEKSERDSVMAFTYRKRIEKDSFEGV